MGSMNYEKIGAFISKRRREKGLTQLQLAKLLGVTDRAVSKWERAKSFPDVSLLKPLCEALDISIGDLFEGEEMGKAEPSQTAAEAAVRGISAYTEQFKKKTIRNLMFAVAVCVICIAIAAWFWYQSQPLDFAKGDFEIGKITMGQAGTVFGETKTFSLPEEFAEEYEMQIKKTLATFSGAEPAEKLKIGYCEPYLEIAGVGKFYETGYEDGETGKQFTFYYMNYQQLQTLCSHIYEETIYRNNSKKEYHYGKCVLRFQCDIPEKAAEVITESYRKFLKKHWKREYDPDAYIKGLDVVEIERLAKSEYEKLPEFPLIEKELAYYKTFDYRIYRVKTNWTYSETLKTYGPQQPEGLREEIRMVIDKGYGDGYEVYDF